MDVVEVGTRAIDPSGPLRVVENQGEFFEAATAFRKVNGELNFKAFRSSDDPNIPTM